MCIITGFSRSGTSFVSQAIQRLGGEFGAPEQLIGGDRWNQRGYFENRAVNALNHRLLFGRWSDPRLWIDAMWPKNPWIHLRKLATIAQGPLISRPALIRRRGRELRVEMMNLGRSLEGKIVKDPRFNYLMEPWAATSTVHSVLYVVRHPHEAAMSMSRQTKIPLRLTYIGWVDAIEKFWSNPPDVPIHIVGYNAFFDPDRCAALWRCARWAASSAVISSRHWPKRFWARCSKSGCGRRTIPASSSQERWRTPTALSSNARINHWHRTRPGGVEADLRPMIA